jgi:hypothetical protein
MNIQMSERLNEIAVTVVASSDVWMYSPCRDYRPEWHFSLEVILNIFQSAEPQIIRIVSAAESP